MQDDNLLQNTFLVQAGVVGGAMLLLLIIIAYLHFDEKISNFFGNCQKGYAKMVKTTKAKVRHRVVRTQKSAKARVMTKLKMIRGDNTVHTDKVEKILKDILDLNQSASPSVKLQIIAGKVRLRCKGKLSCP